MDECGFRQFLKRSGKKPHVVEELVDAVCRFEEFLQAGIELGAATEQHVREYAEALTPQSRKARMRAVALYYKSSGNLPLAKLASDIREQAIARTRKSPKLREFRGVEAQDLGKLEAAGIATVDLLLAAGKTPKARRELAARINVELATILELVKLSDLSRLTGVKCIRARLYHDAGVDTPAKFAEWEPDALREHLVEWVKRTGFDGVAPLPKEIRHTIATARELPKVVSY
jgi:hypothetical protein